MDPRPSGLARHPRLAFVDIETTGLGHARHRIAEIGVVTVDETGVVDEWTTLLDPGRRVMSDEEFGGEARFTSQSSRIGLPQFADIAHELAERLRDRLFVAHNARFDYAFVQAEMRRAGIAFSQPALCTMMLSRRLHPEHGEHHLDALIERHDLDRVERHRALPDARALHQLWQTLVRSTPKRTLDRALGDLLAGPLLPPHLDAGMIDALPEKPGVFVLEDEGGRALHLGRAANLRRHVVGYFRVDRQCASADDFSHRVRAIRADVANGPLDARLIEIAKRATLMMPTSRKRQGVVSIRVDPAADVVAEPVLVADHLADDDEPLFGLFATERKARNVLAKIATRRGVCASLLGLPASRCVVCAGGFAHGGDLEPTSRCGERRPQHLARFFAAIAPLRLRSWPYRGPVAIREGRKVHVFDRWRHLGSVRSASDVARLLEQRPNGFDPDVYVALMQVLPRVNAISIRVLSRKVRDYA